MRIRFFGRIIVVPPWLKYTVIGLILASLSVAGYFIAREAKSGVVSKSGGSSYSGSFTADETSNGSLPSYPAEVPGEKVITVYIVGAIETSDVYDLPEGSILNDLVALAGGFAEGADREAVNLAAALSNGMMIRIPYIGDKDKEWIVDGGNTGHSAGIKDGGLVNINTAGVSELCTLPGVGESTALKIISYRTENGPFGSIAEIMNVGGIKAAKYNEVKNYITVD